MSDGRPVPAHGPGACGRGTPPAAAMEGRGAGSSAGGASTVSGATDERVGTIRSPELRGVIGTAEMRVEVDRAAAEVWARFQDLYPGGHADFDPAELAEDLSGVSITDPGDERWGRAEFMKDVITEAHLLSSSLPVGIVETEDVIMWEVRAGMTRYDYEELGIGTSGGRDPMGSLLDELRRSDADSHFFNSGRRPDAVARYQRMYARLLEKSPTMRRRLARGLALEGLVQRVLAWRFEDAEVLYRSTTLEEAYDILERGGFDRMRRPGASFLYTASSTSPTIGGGWARHTMGKTEFIELKIDKERAGHLLTRVEYHLFNNGSDASMYVGRDGIGMDVPLWLVLCREQEVRIADGSAYTDDGEMLIREIVVSSDRPYGADERAIIREDLEEIAEKVTFRIYTPGPQKGHGRVD